jgi:hypothetical protein
MRHGRAKTWPFGEADGAIVPSSRGAYDRSRMTDLFRRSSRVTNPTGSRFKPVPMRVLLPNLVTLLSLCAGLTAMRLAVEGKLENAVIAILVAAVLDGLDGRLARLLKGTSRFGRTRFAGRLRQLRRGAGLHPLHLRPE